MVMDGRGQSMVERDECMILCTPYEKRYLHWEAIYWSNENILMEAPVLRRGTSENKME